MFYTYPCVSRKIVFGATFFNEWWIFVVLVHSAVLCKNVNIWIFLAAVSMLTSYCSRKSPFIIKCDESSSLFSKVTICIFACLLTYFPIANFKKKVHKRLKKRVVLAFWHVFILFFRIFHELKLLHICTWDMSTRVWIIFVMHFLIWKTFFFPSKNYF